MRLLLSGSNQFSHWPVTTWIEEWERATGVQLGAPQIAGQQLVVDVHTASTQRLQQSVLETLGQAHLGPHDVQINFLPDTAPS
jgi:hypothetical protein